jgi:hypothetical protein
MQFAILCVVCLSLWAPVILWYFSPQRQRLTSNGQLLFMGTALLQFMATVFVVVVVALSHAEDERRARAASRLLGWGALLPALAWSYWVALSALDIGGESQILGGLCVFFLALVLVPMRFVRVRGTLTLIATSLVLIASWVITADQPAPVLIAPATAYVLAVHAAYCLSARE